jgi:hypothetical protein
VRSINMSTFDQTLCTCTLHARDLSDDICWNIITSLMPETYTDIVDYVSFWAFSVSEEG